HDLALMDWIAENVHIVYGTPGAFGVITEVRTSSRAINSFLSGFLREENIRIRPDEIKFESRSIHRYESGFEVTKWSPLTKNLGDFSLSIADGRIHSGEIVGCLGRNALGKTTFARLLAGEMQPDSGEIEKNIKIAYKPQYISTNFGGTCEEMLILALKEKITDTFVKSEIFHPLGIDDIMQRNVPELSGGELQRLSIALNLAIDADLYLLDEPSAHLDSAYRMV
ncbi:RNase L inhibitor, partial [mine drainage metagenome]